MSVFFSPPPMFSSKVETAGCYCEYQNTYLLLKRSPSSSQGNTWGVPGGKIEKGETLAQGVIREVKEETGLIVDPKNLLLKGTAYIRNNGLEYTFHLFYTSFDSFPGQVLLNREHTEYRWASFEEALCLPLIAGAEELLAFIHIKPPQG